MFGAAKAPEPNAGLMAPEPKSDGGSAGLAAAAPKIFVGGCVNVEFRADEPNALFVAVVVAGAPKILVPAWPVPMDGATVLPPNENGEAAAVVVVVATFDPPPKMNDDAVVGAGANADVELLAPNDGGAAA